MKRVGRFSESGLRRKASNHQRGRHHAERMQLSARLQVAEVDRRTSAKALRLARSKARRLEDANLGTAHILLGMLQEGEGIGCRVLKTNCIGVEEIEDALATVTREQ